MKYREVQVEESRGGLRIELKGPQHALSLLFNQYRDVTVYHETSWSLESMTTGAAVWFFLFRARSFWMCSKQGDSGENWLKP